MTEVGDGVVDKVEAGRLRHRVSEDLDVVAILGGSATAVVIDSLRI